MEWNGIMEYGIMEYGIMEYGIMEYGIQKKIEMVFYISWQR
jgi:hypothetical protein